MKDKTTIYRLIDGIFLFILGLLFLILPHEMLEWIGLIVGLYFLIKGLVEFIIHYIAHDPIWGSVTGGFYILVGLTSILFWSVLIKALMIAFGVILILAGLIRFGGITFQRALKKAWGITLIGGIIEIAGGIAVIVLAHKDPDILGRVSGGILLGLSLSIFASLIAEAYRNRHQSGLTFPSNNSTPNNDAIEADIIQETDQDLGE